MLLAGKTLRHLEEDQAPAAERTENKCSLLTNGSNYFVALRTRLHGGHNVAINSMTVDRFIARSLLLPIYGSGWRLA
jgi:hypothetical protein